MALLWAHQYDQPPALTTKRPDIPDAVDAVLAKALAKSPDDRYDSCLAFVSALRIAARGPLTGGGTGSRTDAGAAPAPGRPGPPPEPRGGPGRCSGAEFRRGGDPAARRRHGCPPRPGSAGLHLTLSADALGQQSAEETGDEPPQHGEAEGAHTWGFRKSSPFRPPPMSPRPRIDRP